MLPLRDHNPTGRFPIVNYTIIAFCVLAFLISLGAPDFEALLFEWGFVPNLATIDADTLRRSFASMFLHGGFMHIIGNMWFLHIFGDNVEDRMGHIKYALFYLASGVAALLLQYIVSLHSAIPMIGASGAISGVVGAYFILFRGSQIETLVPVVGFARVVTLPATVVIGYWFITQLFSGAGSLVNFDVNGGGVAWFAHIGGFLFGFLVAKLMRNTGPLGKWEE